jgi:hypothetical protein
MQFYLTQVSNVIRAKVRGKVISPNLFSLTGIYIPQKQKLVLFKQLLLNTFTSTHTSTSDQAVSRVRHDGTVGLVDGTSSAPS